MVSKTLLEELRIILKEEYNLVLDDISLSKFGNALVGYFDLLLRIETRSKKAEMEAGGKTNE